ncbi:unnamed protein product [Caenorhabditis bovis]|uniref:Uncharacterized protein n=1 Tax=Caenorhabditis bovis TaxID=2654633 RepID=A0A8S1FFN6_9PELO|nr:unnamed protein product [Caenorhabditis bovis]
MDESDNEQGVWHRLLDDYYKLNETISLFITMRTAVVLLLILEQIHQSLEFAFVNRTHADKLRISSENIQKLFPLPTLPTVVNTTKRVGAKRFRQFGPRCQHMEKCNDCVCCGICNTTEFTCHIVHGEIDYCRLYEFLTRNSNVEDVELPKIH